MQTLIKETTWYICEKCQTPYSDEEFAKACESRPLTQDFGLKVGNIIRIVKGEYKKQLAKITNLRICNTGYGICDFEKYWHTPYYQAKMINDPGFYCELFFDWIEIVIDEENNEN